MSRHIPEHSNFGIDPNLYGMFDDDEEEDYPLVNADELIDFTTSSKSSQKQQFSHSHERAMQYHSDDEDMLFNNAHRLKTASRSQKLGLGALLAGIKSGRICCFLTRKQCCMSLFIVMIMAFLYFKLFVEQISMIKPVRTIPVVRTSSEPSRKPVKATVEKVEPAPKPLEEASRMYIDSPGEVEIVSEGDGWHPRLVSKKRDPSKVKDEFLYKDGKKHVKHLDGHFRGPKPGGYDTPEQHIIDLCKGRDGKIGDLEVTLFPLFADRQAREICLKAFEGIFDPLPEAYDSADAPKSSVYGGRNSKRKKNGRNSDATEGKSQLQMGDFQQINFFMPEPREVRTYHSGFPFSRRPNVELWSDTKDHFKILKSLRHQMESDYDSIFMILCVREKTASGATLYRMSAFATYSLGDITTKAGEPRGGAIWRLQIESKYKHRGLCPNFMNGVFDVVMEIREDLYPWTTLVIIIDASWSYFTSHHQSTPYEKKDYLVWEKDTTYVRDLYNRLGQEDKKGNWEAADDIRQDIVTKAKTPGCNCYKAPFNTGRSEYSNMVRTAGPPDKPEEHIKGPTGVPGAKMEEYNFPDFGHQKDLYPGCSYFIYWLPERKRQDMPLNKYGRPISSPFLDLGQQRYQNQWDDYGYR